jgi:hypothetical protein
MSGSGIADAAAARERQTIERQNAMSTWVPTPRQVENDGFVVALANNTLPMHGVIHSWDGSPVDGGATVPTPPTWP